VEHAGALPKAVAPVGPVLERRRQFGPTELAAAWRQRLAREELPLFRVMQRAAPEDVDEILVAQLEAGEPPDAWPPRRRSGAALVGSTVHAVLRNIDFEWSRAGCDAEELERLAAQCAVEFDPLASRVELREVTELVKRFLRSPLARALAESPVCHRELEFLLRWTPQDARQRGRRRDPLPERYLRGFLDCVYQDAQGGWHLVDYKTDDVGAEGVAERAEQYRLQLAIYAMAAQRQFGGGLQSAQLYFLRPGVAWELEMSGTWAERARVEIEAAIEELVARPRVG
jgi:ATP-dependent exoDNAse (exonuclease V) beta subunit